MNLHPIQWNLHPIQCGCGALTGEVSQVARGIRAVDADLDALRSIIA